jgi:signal transduction histidine kinase
MKTNAVTVMIVLAMVLSMAAGAFPASGEARNVRVGVYDNHPKLYIAEDGRPDGIFVNIMDEIALREGWTVEYIFNTWAENLEMLESGKLDILLDVSYSEERSKKFVLNRVALIDDWLQVFNHGGVGISTVRDLAGKKIAVLGGGIQERFLKTELGTRFNIDYTVMAFPDYAGTVRALNAGIADAIVASRFFYHSRLRSGNIKPTPVIFRPEGVYFAFTRGVDERLVRAVDQHVASLKNDAESVYYRSLNRQLGDSRRAVIPAYVKWSVAAVTGFLVLALLMSFLLKLQVNRKTAELRRKNNDLRLAMEDAANRERLHALGQMAGGIAHDFNNILVPISGFVDILLNVPGALEDRDKARSILHNVKEAVCDGAEIIRRMREFYREKKSFKKYEKIDINRVAEDVLVLTRPKWGSSGAITIQKMFSPGCEIDGVRMELRELFINLIFNAVDAMPEGGTLILRTECQADTVRIVIQDTGTGMTQDVLKNCIHPFFTTKGEMGTGIGLAMVHETILGHGGSLSITSEPGRGSRFTIDLPKDFTRDKESR